MNKKNEFAVSIRKPLFVAMTSGDVVIATVPPAAAATSLNPQAIYNFNFPGAPYTAPQLDSVNFLANVGGTAGALQAQLFNDLNGTGGTALTFPFVNVSPG